MLNKKKIGNRGESLACEFLKNRGFAIAARNYRSRYGEIDIVLKKDRSYRFVEVKFRRSLTFGLPQESVFPLKQQRIRNAAISWLRAYKLPLDSDIHFDVLAVTETKRGKIEYDYIEDAF